MNNEIILIIAGSAFVTYLTRFPFMLISGKKELPAKLVRFMSFIAPAVLTSLIIPCIFIRDNQLDFSLSNPYILAAVATVITAYFSKNMLASIIVGMGCVGLLTLL